MSIVIVPDPSNPQTTQAVTKLVNSAAWVDRMEKWGAGYADLTRASIINMISEGAGPIAVARRLRELATTMPRHAAENLMRTLQLTAYREASLLMEQINGGFIIGKIRMATLDNRTCLACISLHGTKLEPGQRVDDHYRGRCTEYYIVPGGAPAPSWMQVDSTPGNRNFVPYQTGIDWFNGLPPARQMLQASFVASPAKWNAFQSGVPLSQFVLNVTDSVFGNQIVENSLKGMLGQEQAETFYVRNQP